MKAFGPATKRVRVQMIGSGKEGDPFRVRLPVYVMVDPDYGAMTAVVDVPASSYPPAPVGKPETVTQDAKNGAVITDVSLEQAIDSTQFYDKKYQEHTGTFVLEAM